LLKDPTFRNDTWATRQALEAETSGYFLVPPGPLPKGWRAVEPAEGDTVWGKGVVSVLEPGGQTPRDFHTGPPVCDGMMAPTVHHGMMAPTVHLMTVNLSLVDQPVGYSPPVGPAVPFVIRYNSLDGFQPANAAYSNFGPQWSCDWISFITDDPANSLADVYYFIGGGQRTFTGFDTNTQSFAYQQYDETLLTRTSTDPISYTMLWPDGSQMIFSQSDGSFGTARRVFLTQVIDPQNNAVTLTYDGLLRLVAITDAIGQVTTINHGLPGVGLGTIGPCTLTNTVLDDPYKITQVTDPFGRSATFGYAPEPIGYFTCTKDINNILTTLTNYISAYLLTNITDVEGLVSRVSYSPGTNVFGYSVTTNGNFSVTDYTSVSALTTPYGTSHFSLSYGNGVDRIAEITHPDGSLERVEFNDDTSGIPGSDPSATLPQGMPLIDNNNLVYRNTFYWSRNACATSYRDYTKARIFHWLHASASVSSGILESTKEPLENRVWYAYAGQGEQSVGANNLPTQIGRVLDDGSTQLFAYGYNSFGRVTNAVDPLGRTFAYIYASNGIDLQEIHMTTAGKNELLFSATYNSQHRPLTTTDAAGQTTSYSYNARGQILTATDPKGETITCHYDTNGYLLAVDGPLPGPNDTVTASYDAFGRIGTLTDVSGYRLTFDYDNLDRVTQITYPDATFEQITYDRLDPSVYRDRAGRLTLFDYDSLRQLTQVTDPLGRVTRFGWCRCGALKSLSDSLGRTTSWQMDVQGRPIAKQFADGSQITYAYENTTSRLRQITDQKQQLTYFSYNLDNTLNLIGYANDTVPTPAVSFTYDPNYRRVTSMTDGIGTRLYSYIPVTGTPALGAGRLAGITGPLANETITYGYDALGRRVHRAIEGVDWATAYDSAGRIVGATNALGSFSYAYDGSSLRLLFKTFPNAQTSSWSYGTVLQDFALQGITHQFGVTPLSQFLYTHDVPAQQINTWSQQAGAQPPSFYSFTYDAANQLLSANVTNSGALANTYAYSYDLAANRLAEQAGPSNYTATYNALNQLSTTTAPAGSSTNEWDGANRLTAVNAGNERAEFAYDGVSRLVGIRQLVNGVEVSHRMFAWDGRHIREERDTNGVVTKRFFAQGVQLVTGTNAGLYYYTRDHLGSIRELTDVGGNIRARYAYDPFGRKTRLSGDLDADFGFGGMLWATEANLYVTHFRAYDPNLGRWLSRDPLRGAEARQGPNLYAYVGNEPVSRSDPSGLAPTLPGGLNSVTIGLAAAAATDPGGVQTFLVEVGEAAGPALEALAPTLQAGAPALEAQAPAVVNCVQTAAGYAGGPLPEQVVEFADAVLPEVAQAAQTTDAEVYQAATDWIESTLRATADWRTSLPFDEQVEAYNSIWSASEILFGERWWWWRANLW